MPNVPEWKFDKSSRRYYYNDGQGNRHYEQPQRSHGSGQEPRSIPPAAPSSHGSGGSQYTAQYSDSGRAPQSTDYMYTTTGTAGASFVNPSQSGLGKQSTLSLQTNENTYPTSPSINQLTQSMGDLSMVPPTQQSQPMPAIEPSAQMQQPLPQNAWQGSDGIRHVDVLNPANQVRTYVQTGPAELITPAPLFKQGIKSHMRVMGTEGDTDRLFKDFRKRSRPRDFFTVGKVFRVLWSEPAGETSTLVSALEAGLTIGIHGEQVFSKVRRFVVVRAADSYCAALPIVTYGRRGVSKPGTNKCEHGIVYTGKLVPEPLLDEAPQGGERPMQPEAIRINPDILTEKLDVVSRIDYGKVYTIQHNIKVKSFGVVHPKSTEWLLKQFRDVWNDSDSPSTMAKKGKQRDSRSVNYHGKTTTQAGLSGSSQSGTAPIGTAQGAYGQGASPMQPPSAMQPVANTQLVANPTASRTQGTYQGQPQFMAAPQVPSRAQLHENALQQLMQKGYTRDQALEYVRRYVEWYMEHGYNRDQAIHAVVNQLTMPSQGP